MGLLDGIQRKQLEKLKHEIAFLRAENERLTADNKNLGGWGTTIDRLLLQLVDGQGQITGTLAVQRGMLRQMATQLDTMTEVLNRVAANETTVGQDLQKLFDAIAANPTQDLTNLIAQGNRIADNLIASDAKILAALPPAPPTP